MTKSIKNADRPQGKKIYRTLIGTVALALLTAFPQHWLSGPAHAQTTVPAGDKRAPPSQSEIDRALTDLLLCEWMTDEGSALGSDRFLDVLEHLAENNPAKGGEALVGEFRVIGHVFHRILTVAAQGGGGALGWSTTSSTEAIVQTLQERGYTFEPMTRPMVGFSGKMTRGRVDYFMWVGNGYHPFGPQKSVEGVTMMCGAREKE